MSKAKEIKAALQIRPFQPFTIRLADQRTFLVSRPSKIAFSEDETEFAIASKTFQIIHISQVTGIEMPVDMVLGEPQQ